MRTHIIIIAILAGCLTSTFAADAGNGRSPVPTGAGLEPSSPEYEAYRRTVRSGRWLCDETALRYDAAHHSGLTVLAPIQLNATAGVHYGSEGRVDAAMTDTLYAEKHRPQFHFTARANWLNDPNGLVYYKGRYHLFFQHNPSGINWGNMTWGHAVSPDLVHWTQVEHAILPDRLGTIFSGSAVVDRENSSGFGTGSEKPLVAFYTAAGGTSEESNGQPFTQCIAFSTDAGDTWTKYAGNPVIRHIGGSNRDPKVIRYEDKWLMVLYIDGDMFALFESEDTKSWTKIQDFRFPDHSECPDFFPMRLLGVTKWVLTAANGDYYIGAFDGRRFTPESGPHRADYGANHYAVQTYSDAPDGRRIQIAWMNGGKYPEMPFNQQMSFPTELKLKSFPEGLRICRLPVREIEGLREKEYVFKDKVLEPGKNLLAGISGHLFDISAQIELKDASGIEIKTLGETIGYSAGKLTCLGKTADLPPVNGRIKLRILVDRTSIEVYGNDGKVCMTSCFLPTVDQAELSMEVQDGSARVVSMKVFKLKSTWQK